MLGAQVVVRALARRGVTTIFSLSGNQIMPLYDACIDARIRIVHVRHEAAAVFMADAWAQVTGQVGVALLTAGPGLANGVAPLYSAAQAESPVLLLSGDSPVGEDGLGAFQEMDQVAITAPLTKRSLRVRTGEELVPAIDAAIDLALGARPGPVHLALPFDVLTRQSGVDALPATPVPHVLVPAGAADLAALAALIAQAQRPVLLLGPAQWRGPLRATWQGIARRLQLPVLPMESPRGLRDPALGSAAPCIAEADLVLLAGKRLDFTLGFGRGAALAPDVQVVALDADAAMLARAATLLGARLVLQLQADAAQTMAAVDVPVAERTGWLHTVQAAVTHRRLPAPPVVPGRLSSQALCEAVQRFIAERPDTILVCDGGEFGQWAQAFCRAETRIVNGVAGAIGGGICHAIAAKIARPDATVLLLMGDGTAGFHFTEFDTAVREHAAFIAVVGNDLRWNAEHQIQLRSYGPARLVGCGLAASARYEAAAEAFGGFGAAVQSVEALRAALASAAASGLPACLNVAIAGEAAPVFTQRGGAH